MNDAAQNWTRAKEELVRTVVSLGFPSELGDAVARHLGSPKAIDRMTAYLNCEKPTDANTVVDEMLAIRAEIDAWKRKKAAAESNSAYNDLLYYGLGEEHRKVDGAPGQSRCACGIRKSPISGAESNDCKTI